MLGSHKEGCRETSLVNFARFSLIMTFDKTVVLTQENVGREKGRVPGLG